MCIERGRERASTHVFIQNGNLLMTALCNRFQLYIFRYFHDKKLEKRMKTLRFHSGLRVVQPLSTCG